MGVTQPNVQTVALLHHLYEDPKIQHYVNHGVQFEQRGRAYDGIEGEESIQERRPDVVILDVRMPGLSGLDLQRRLTEMELDLPLIFLSRDADVPTAVQAIRAGAVDFLEKPAAPARLLRRIRQALESVENAPAEA